MIRSAPVATRLAAPVPACRPGDGAGLPAAVDPDRRRPLAGDARPQRPVRRQGPPRPMLTQRKAAGTAP